MPTDTTEATFGRFIRPTTAQPALQDGGQAAKLTRVSPHLPSGRGCGDNTRDPPACPRMSLHVATCVPDVRNFLADKFPGTAARGEAGMCSLQRLRCSASPLTPLGSWRCFKFSGLHRGNLGKKHMPSFQLGPADQRAQAHFPSLLIFAI